MRCACRGQMKGSGERELTGPVYRLAAMSSLRRSSVFFASTSCSLNGLALSSSSASTGLTRHLERSPNLSTDSSGQRSSCSCCGGVASVLTTKCHSVLEVVVMP